MKLTPHQKEIVEEIIKERVVDIPSYLRVFNKGRNQQYDSFAIQEAFDKVEAGKTYLFREDNAYYYTDIYDCNGKVSGSFRGPNTMTYEFKENPLSAPVKARLEMRVKPERVEYQGKNYSFNFLEKNYLIADTFDDIKDFIALWSYKEQISRLRLFIPSRTYIMMTILIMLS